MFIQFSQLSYGNAINIIYLFHFIISIVVGVVIVVVFVMISIIRSGDIIKLRLFCVFNF